MPCNSISVTTCTACTGSLLDKKGAIESDSLYTVGDPAITRQRLFGDIAPVYDEVSLSQQKTALKGLEPLVIEH